MELNLRRHLLGLPSNILVQFGYLTPYFHQTLLHITSFYLQGEGGTRPNSGIGGPLMIRDLHNSSYDTKSEFNNCFIIHSK